jgi:pectate lyase
MVNYAALALLPVALGYATPLSSRAGCAAPVDGLVGYGAGVTGGGSGSGTTVTSCSELSSALEGGGVVTIDGILTDCGILDVPSDTTVIGVGADSGKFIPIALCQYVWYCCSFYQ